MHALQSIENFYEGLIEYFSCGQKPFDLKEEIILLDNHHPVIIKNSEAHFSLPAELIMHILQHFTALSEVAKTFTVSKKWYKIALQDPTWHALILRHFPHIKNINQCNLNNYQTFREAICYLNLTKKFPLDSNLEKDTKTLKEKEKHFSFNDIEKNVIEQMDSVRSKMVSQGNVNKNLIFLVKDIRPRHPSQEEVIKKISHLFKDKFLLSAIQSGQCNKGGSQRKFRFCQEVLIAGYLPNEKLHVEFGSLAIVDKENSLFFCFPIIG